ncbi:MAG TPA: hypothetical protein VFB80_04645 [Pirellulaceae bacterium]|nr:hypothetical protein [Pirellulaceae bacterium]
MEASLAIHTAARRYCLERYACWAERYAEIVRHGRDRGHDRYHYTSEALATFPRYNVLNAIRVELERIDAGELSDFEAVKSQVLRAGETANDEFTLKPIGAIDQRATEEERAAFCSYVARLSPADLYGVEPLPFRRVLAADESESLWSRLRKRWGIGAGCWYPLGECTLPGVEAFDASAFDKAAPPECLRGILSDRRIERVWELREFGPEYELAVALFDPHYDGAEGYWSSGEMDWIVYASHERSVTVGGWLLKEVMSLWPAWQAHLWRGDRT